MKKSKRVRKAKAPVVDTKKLAANDKPETPAATTVSPAVASVRSDAARRTAAGKFTKQVFVKIGGKECPRFGPMTWVQRDAFMEKPEGAAVKERYEAHLASVK
jgi:hypothetical protein